MIIKIIRQFGQRELDAAVAHKAAALGFDIVDPGAGGYGLVDAAGFGSDEIGGGPAGRCRDEGKNASDGDGIGTLASTDSSTSPWLWPCSCASGVSRSGVTDSPSWAGCRYGLSLRAGSTR